MHRGQAPCGALNEKMRGCSSGSETPCSGHAKFCEYVVVSPVSIRSTTTSPSASIAAVSTDCVSRVRRSSFITSRSTTTSIVCLNFLSSAGGSSSVVCSPSTLIRENPSLRSSSNRSRNSPFRSRTTGAFTVKRVPSGSCRICSTIESIDCPAIGRPHTGQCGRPTRAYSSRR